MSAHLGERPFRRAVLRGGVASVLLALVAGACDALAGIAPLAGAKRVLLFEPAILGFSVGLVAIPTALVELLGARSKPRLAREAFVLVATFAVAFLALALALLQGFYAVSLVSEHSWDVALGTVETGARGMVRDRRDFAVVLAAAAVVFGVLAALRQRRRSLASETCLLLLATGALGFPILHLGRGGGAPVIDIGIWLVLGASVLPLAARIADALDDRIQRKLVGAEPPLAPPVASRSARAIRGLVSGLAVVALAAALVLGAERVLGVPHWRPRPSVPLRPIHPPAVDPRLLALAPELVRWEAGKLTPDEIATLFSSAITTSIEVRACVAPGDPEAVTRHFRAGLLPWYDLGIQSYAVELDGKPLALTREGQCMVGTGRASVQGVAVTLDDLVAIVPPGLSPGRHVVRSHYTVVVTRGGGKTLFSSAREDTCSFEVGPGGEPVRLVRPELAPGAFEAGGARWVPGNGESLDLYLKDLPVAVAGRLEVRDDAGELVHLEVENPGDVDSNGGVRFLGSGEGMLIYACPSALSPTLRSDNWIFLDGTPSGDLMITIVPDARAALTLDSSCREIYGRPLTAKVAVEVRR